jgi:hypothetical protein
MSEYMGHLERSQEAQRLPNMRDLRVAVRQAELMEEDGLDEQTALFCAMTEVDKAVRLKERVRQILGIPAPDEEGGVMWSVAMLEAFGTDEAKAAVAQAREELKGM